MRMAEAETGLAHGDGERRAALRHHLSRMENLNAACRMRSCGGESRGPDAMAGNFVVEAKRWVAASAQ
jgi:hypothetical protein